MAKNIKHKFNQQSATFKLRQPINEGRVMFTIDDQKIDSLFLSHFEDDVDYIHDGPDVYYVTDENDLEKFIDVVHSMGLNADAIKPVTNFQEDMGGNVTTNAGGYLASLNAPSKKQNPFKEDVLSGYTQDKNFRPGHTPDKGGFQYKDLWGLNEVYKEPKTNAEELARVEAYYKEASPSQKASAEDRIKKLKIVVGIEKRTDKKLPVLTYGTFWVDYLKKQGVKDYKELEAKYSKSKTDENKMSVLREMEETIDEIFSREDYQKVMQIIDKIRYTNTSLYNAIMDLVDDLYPHDYDEVEALVSMNENYSRFKNETKTRTKPEQFHQAVKSVKRKVEEIHKLYEYMERLKNELSESSDGLKYKKYTENAILKIKEAVKALHIKTKKLK